MQNFSKISPKSCQLGLKKDRDMSVKTTVLILITRNDELA